jgi:antitoxin HicB
VGDDNWKKRDSILILRHEFLWVFKDCILTHLCYILMMQGKKRTFSVEIIQEADGVNYYVIVPALAGCFSQGKTVEEAKKNIAKAIKLHLKALQKAGEPIPDEGSTYQTTIQVAA